MGDSDASDRCTLQALRHCLMIWNVVGVPSVLTVPCLPSRALQTLRSVSSQWNVVSGTSWSLVLCLSRSRPRGMASLFPVLSHKAGGRRPCLHCILQCTELDHDKQASLLRVRIFLVFIDSYLIFFYCTARCSK